MNPSKKLIRSEPFVPTHVPTNPLEQLMTKLQQKTNQQPKNHLFFYTKQRMDNN